MTDAQKIIAGVLKRHEWWLAGNIGIPGMVDATTYKCLCGWNGDGPREHLAAEIDTALGGLKVPVGVISLNSTLLATRSDWQRDDPRSILSAMYAPTFDRLTALLHAIAIDAISSDQSSSGPAAVP